MHGIMEEYPLLLVQEDVVPLRRGDSWNAGSTWVHAFSTDPQMQYLRGTPRPSHFMNFVDSVSMTAIIYLLMNRTVALAIKYGAALVIVKPPVQDSEPKGPLDKARNIAIHALAMIVSRSVGTPELRKRNRELEAKMDETIKFVLGNRVKEMLHISLLATDPQCQGHGYGGALLGAVSSLADVLDQAIWLQSSNVQNSAFYQAHGFKTIAEVVLGDQNPTWHKAPVIIEIMIREPRGR